MTPFDTGRDEGPLLESSEKRGRWFGNRRRLLPLLILGAALIISLVTYAIIAATYFGGDSETTGRYETSENDVYEYDPIWDIDTDVGYCRGVAVRPDGEEIFITGRGNVANSDMMYVFDMDGNRLRTWGDGELEKAHSVRFQQVDGQLYAWAVDLNAISFKKFTVTGEKLEELSSLNGQGFAGPTDIAFDNEGNIYLNDGGECSTDDDCVSSIHKLGPQREGEERELIWTVSGIFDRPHPIVYDAEYNRILSGDARGGELIFIDADTGDVLASWECGFTPIGVAIYGQHILVVDAYPSVLDDDYANTFVVLEKPGAEIASECQLLQRTDISQDQFAHLAGVNPGNGDAFIAHLSGIPSYLSRWVLR